jgi:mannose-6-phosphate isomerase-like protein (cupin superfamily)
VLRPGDCVLQPPAIRHRVLACSDGLEVIEVTAPAEHITRVEQELALPNAPRPHRTFAGQRFVRFEAARARWQPSGAGGWHSCDLGVAAATQSLLGAAIVRGPAGARTSVRHTDARWLWYVLRGELEVGGAGTAHRVGAGQALVLPPHEAVSLCAATDLELLEVRMRAAAAAQQ